MSIIGDSYTGGTSLGGQGKQGWPSLVDGQLHRHGVEMTPAVGFEDGSGYVHPGNRRGYVFDDQVAKVVGSNDRLVVLFGSRNDVDAPAVQLTDAVERTFADVKKAAPKSRLLVIGPAWSDANPPAGVFQARDIVKAEAAKVNATFVDPLAEGWFFDRPDLISTDGINPTNEGHVYLADKIAVRIGDQLLH